MSGPVTNVVIPIEGYGRMMDELNRLPQIEALLVKRAGELADAKRLINDLQHDLGVANAMLDHAKALNGKLHTELAEANEDNAILYNAVQNLLRQA